MVTQHVLLHMCINNITDQSGWRLYKTVYNFFLYYGTESCQYEVQTWKYYRLYTLSCALDKPSNISICFKFLLLAYNIINAYLFSTLSLSRWQPCWLSASDQIQQHREEAGAPNWRSKITQKGCKVSWNSQNKLPCETSFSNWPIQNTIAYIICVLQPDLSYRAIPIPYCKKLLRV